MGEHKHNPFARGTTVNSSEGAQDRFGRPLQVGDLVLLPGMGTTLFLVVGERPVLDPKLPPNCVELRVQATTVVVTPRGQRSDLLLVFPQAVVPNPPAVVTPGVFDGPAPAVSLVKEGDA